jgi:hypothetical protein
MTRFVTALLTVAALAALTVGCALAASGDPAGPRIAVVIDADAARSGRELVDPRLRDLDAELRLPRTAAEARTNLRYFHALGYRVVAIGPRTTAAARATGVPAAGARGIGAALALASGR